MALFGDPRINATFTATDKVTPVVKGMRREMTALGSKTGGPLGGLIGGIGGLNLGMVGLGIAGVGVVGVLGDAAHAAAEDRASTERLTTAIKANVEGWDGNTSAIEKAIAAGQDLSFTDDDIRDSMTQLIARTHDVTKAIDLMRTAEDLARFKKIGLSDAAMIVGKVFSGQVSAARRAGIAISKTADSTQALAEIQKAAAGQAETYADSEVGAAERIQIRIDELKEAVGYQLQPVLDTALETIDALLSPPPAPNQTLLDLIKQMKGNEVGGNVNAATGAVNGLTEAVQKLVDQAGAGTTSVLDLGLAAIQGKGDLAQMHLILSDLGKQANITGTDLDLLSQNVLDGNITLNQAVEILNRLTTAHKATADMEAYHHRNDYLVKESTDAMVTSLKKARPAVAAVARAFKDMGPQTHSEIESAKQQIVADMNELWYDIKHPDQMRDFESFVSRKMASALRAMKRAQNIGDDRLVAEAQDAMFRLMAIYGRPLPDIHVPGLPGPAGPPPSRNSIGGGRHRTPNSLGASGGEQHIHINVDGHEIAKVVNRRLGLGYSTAGTGSRN